ncbi:hypothetical protein EON79_01730 [bacterium]|nr:MAG: hypothetical protein EON79_01730 [bacterium]
MQFERKKQLFAFSALVLGLAMAGCSGDGGAGVTNYPVIGVDSTLGLGTGTVLSSSGGNQSVNLTDGTSGFRPAGTSSASDGSTVGTIETLVGILPGLSSDTANRPLLLSRLEEGQTEAPVPTTISGIYLQPNGAFTEGLEGGASASRADLRKVVLPNGEYKVRLNGPLFVRNAGNTLTISTYLQIEFTVANGRVGLPNTLVGTLPANGSPGAGLSLTTGQFQGVGGTTSLSLRGTNANRDQNQTISNGGSATFRFSNDSDFSVPTGGLTRVIYRANRSFAGNVD